ncbi:UNVERIFIED_CONTAM: hypothetical protein NCL1_63026 [Trichonephila clavipes]
METFQQMPRSLRPGKSWEGIYKEYISLSMSAGGTHSASAPRSHNKLEQSQLPTKILIDQQPEINDKEPELEAMGTVDDLSKIKCYEEIFLHEDGLESFASQFLSKDDEADNSRHSNDSVSKILLGKPSLNLFSDPPWSSVSENEICFDQSHLGNMDDNSFLEDMDPSQQNLRVDDLFPDLLLKESPLEMQQNELLKDGIEADEPSTEMKENALLQISNTKKNIDQNILETVKDPPVLELM